MGNEIHKSHADTPFRGGWPPRAARGELSVCLYTQSLGFPWGRGRAHRTAEPFQNFADCLYGTREPLGPEPAGLDTGPQDQGAQPLVLAA